MILLCKLEVLLFDLCFCSITRNTKNLMFIHHSRVGNNKYFIVILVVVGSGRVIEGNQVLTISLDYKKINYNKKYQFETIANTLIIFLLDEFIKLEEWERTNERAKFIWTPFNAIWELLTSSFEPLRRLNIFQYQYQNVKKNKMKWTEKQKCIRKLSIFMNISFFVQKKKKESELFPLLRKCFQKKKRMETCENCVLLWLFWNYSEFCVRNQN